MDSINSVARALSPSWHIAKNGGGGSLGSFIRHTNPLFDWQQSGYDAQQQPAKDAASMALLQQRQIMSADNQRKTLLQEEADVGSQSPLRRRGSALVQYLGA